LGTRERPKGAVGLGHTPFMHIVWKSASGLWV
jgi:hypothetical protein